MQSVNAATPRHLLGFWMCVALVVGNTIGSGVFLLPASLAPYVLELLPLIAALLAPGAPLYFCVRVPVKAPA